MPAEWITIKPNLDKTVGRWIFVISSGWEQRELRFDDLRRNIVMIVNLSFSGRYESMLGKTSVKSTKF